LQCISKSLFICSVDFLVRTASTRSNAKTVSQAEHFHAIGLLVWSLKTVAVRTGMAIVSHGPIQDASLAETNPPRALIQKAHLTVARLHSQRRRQDCRVSSLGCLGIPPGRVDPENMTGAGHPGTRLTSRQPRHAIPRSHKLG